MLNKVLKMLSRFQYLDTPKKMNKMKRMLFLYFVLGIALTFILGKMSQVCLDAIAVSEDESQIAFLQKSVKDAPYQKLICSTSEGEILFQMNLEGHTGGGSCSLWFEGNTLYVFTYRPHSILRFGPDGDFEEYSADPVPDPYPDQFAGFSKTLTQSTYRGKQYELIYRKGFYFGLLGESRELVLTKNNGTRILLWTSDTRE